MVMVVMIMMMGVDVSNVLFWEEMETERETCCRYPRWNLVSSVGIGISSSPFPKSSGETNMETETPWDDGKEYSNMYHGDILTGDPKKLCLFY